MRLVSCDLDFPSAFEHPFSVLFLRTQLAPILYFRWTLDPVEEPHLRSVRKFQGFFFISDFHVDCSPLSIEFSACIANIVVFISLCC